MNDEDLKGLIAPATEQSEAAPVEAPPVAEPAAEAPARGPDGKFAPKATEALPEPETPEKPLNKAELAGILNATLSERDKRQAGERRIAELEAKLAEKGEVPNQPEVARPPWLDAFLVRRDISLDRAEDKYGKEEVDKVQAWAEAECNDDETFNQQIFQSRNPYETARAAYFRHSIVSEVQTPDDLAQFKAWKAAQAAGQAEPKPNPTPAPPPPRSLATAPGNGAAARAPVTAGEGEAFASMFSKG